MEIGSHLGLWRVGKMSTWRILVSKMMVRPEWSVQNTLRPASGTQSIFHLVLVGELRMLKLGLGSEILSIFKASPATCLCFWQPATDSDPFPFGDCAGVVVLKNCWRMRSMQRSDKVPGGMRLFTIRFRNRRDPIVNFQEADLQATNLARVRERKGRAEFPALEQNCRRTVVAAAAAAGLGVERLRWIVSLLHNEKTILLENKLL